VKQEGAGPADIRATLVRHADLALAGLVVAIVAMMIVPLPTPLLDLFGVQGEAVTS
jgi:type III secretory pathway component EscV